MRKLLVFDTTLRDGEQSLGRTLHPDVKLEIAQQLAQLGVDVIEAGFPASSPGDFAAVQQIARRLKGVIVCGLTRAVRDDIDRCWEALQKAENPRIHTGIATSPIHMKHKLRKSPEHVLEMAVDAVSYAKRFVDDVEFYAEDATRSDMEFLKRIFSAVIRAGATVINIPDTVGYTTPWQFESMIKELRTKVPELDRVTISVHCHNDLGMATANTLAGVRAGATQIEGTINGIGERAGNASLEEVLMAIYFQPEVYGVRTTVDTREIAETSRLVAARTGVHVPPYKPIVGENAYAHASGIHQDGVLKNPDTYEIIRPEVVGMAGSKLVLTSRSGRHALRARLQQLGHEIDQERLGQLYDRFLDLADTQGQVDDQDLISLVHMTS